MEKTVMIFEDPNMDAKDYDAILKEMETAGTLYNEKRISHVAFERNGKWCVVDIWDSPESSAEFGQKVLQPIFAKLGLNPPQPTVLPVHNYMGTHAEESISA
jgi:hypothetical protein